MKIDKALFILSVVLLVVGCRSGMERHISPSTHPSEAARILEESARRTSDAESFGQSVARSILRDAAQQIRVGGQSPVAVDLAFTVDVIELGPPTRTDGTVRIDPNSPGNIDVCAIICSRPHTGETDVTCYFNCTFPAPEPLPVHFRECKDVWDDYYKCGLDRKCRHKYFWEMIRMGCLEKSPLPIRRADE